MKRVIYMGNRSSLTFTFEGDYEVNAISLVQVIGSLMDLSRAVAEREYPDTAFTMNVKAVTQGSLKFDFVVVEHMAQTLLSPDVVSYASSMIDILSSFFSIKKMLRGKKPNSIEEHVDKIIIENSEGLHIEAPAGASLYFTDNRVDNSVTQVFEAAKNSGGATAVSVKAGKTIEISRDEFDICAQRIDLDCTDNCIKVVRENEILFVRQPDFTGNLKWKFTGDQNISASMLDAEFKRKVQSGEINLNAKTYIIADVQVTVPLKPNGTPDTERTDYEILLVKEIHTPGEGQLKFDV